MNFPIWLGAGSAPPDLVAESKQREEEAVRLTENLWPLSKLWTQPEE
jgi:hypothetical protein